MCVCVCVCVCVCMRAHARELVCPCTTCTCACRCANLTDASQVDAMQSKYTHAHINWIFHTSPPSPA